ncbi:MAG: efflux RND transporter periplasmic adaptor subunit [Anaerolineales bacterium]|nr:efflux RND transporter periplasmic adaptor subunit [Anaerolineales bacterium]
MKKLIAGLLLMLLLAGCAQTDNQQVPSNPAENPSQIEETTISASGTVVPARWANVAFFTGGKDLNLLGSASIGQEVQQGQLLATLNTDAAMLNLKIAQAQLESANATLEQVEDSEIATDQDIDAARAAVEIAAAGVEQAQLNLESTRLYSPIDGTVIDIFVNQGEIVNPGAPILLIADLSSLQVHTSDLSEVDVAKISIGNSAEVVFDALPETLVKGKVLNISLRNAAVAGVYYTVTIELDHIPEGLLWGMSAFTKIEINN